MKIDDKVDLLTLIKFLPNRDSHKMGRFKCDCGNVVDRFIASVNRPRVNPKSCGCVKKKHKKRNQIHAKNMLDSTLACEYLAMKWR